MNKHKCDKVSDNIQNSENPITESALDNLNTDFKYIKKEPVNQKFYLVLLSQEDHIDIKNIFNKVFPQSTDKMKTFLCHKKWQRRGILKAKSCTGISSVCAFLCGVEVRRGMQS